MIFIPRVFLSGLVACSLPLCAITPTAHALVIYDNPTGHTVDPGNGVPWDNIGSIGGTTGVYLGAFANGYWVVTANHVGAGDIILAGQSYTATPGSAQQIGTTDLLLFRIQTAPLLPNLNLLASSPAPGTQVWMVGYGGGTKNWGTNNVEMTYTAGAPTEASALLIDYDPVTGEAQGASGDSGGATFYYSGGNWVFGGTLSAITTSGSPLYTVAIDLGVYNSQILLLTGAAIPEPGTAGLFLGAGVLGLAVALRRRR